MTHSDPGDRAASNPPGRPTIAFRSGTHATFLRRMLDRLHTQTVPPHDADAPRPLAALTTRDSDDPTIALLDVWATVADNLAFYQDRIANEGYLRTATERRSVLELSRAVGYELAPGVAAAAWLVFEVDDAPGSPPSAVVPKGTRVGSIPSQGGMPQTFETSEPLTAWAALNSFRPRLDKPQEWGKESDIKTLVVKGTANNLKAGDHLLLDTGDKQQLVRIQGITLERAAECTRVDLAETAPIDKDVSAKDMSLFVFRGRAGLFGGNAAPQRPIYDGETHKFNFEKWTLVPEDQTTGNKVTLDAEYARVMPGGWVAITQPDIKDSVIRQIATTQPISRSDYGLTAKVTQLALDSDSDWATDLITKIGDPEGMSEWRTIVVYVQSEKLALSLTVPLASDAEPIKGQADVQLDPDFKLDPDLKGKKISRKFIIAGRTTEGEQISQPVEAEIIKDPDGQFTLSLNSSLKHAYRRDTVTFYGNVVHANHGETVVDEVLGSGDASQTNQRFLLRHTPLTYLAAGTASGAVSTLSIRVNGLLWREVPSLLYQGPTRRCYTLRRDNQGRTLVIFGDGVSGARLPTGTENVVATYRYGLGPDGNVPAGALSLLQTRPYGIRGVRNPDAASGGTAPATLPQARALAPQANQTLGRLVSLADYTHFARSFAGIGKAQARLLRRDGQPVIHITLAAEGGGQVPPASDLYQSLLAALRLHGNGLYPIELAGYTEPRFGIKARVKIDARYRADAVKAAVRTKLIETYRFERRTFGQGVSRSDLITDIQTVPGVLAVDLDDPKDGEVPVENAGLLLIDENNIQLEEWP